jgi:hypothetical protein
VAHQIVTATDTSSKLARVGAIEMLTDDMGNLVDAVQALSDRLAPELGPIADLIIAPVLYGEPLADAVQAEANWALALETRVRDLLKRLSQ